MAPMPWAIAFGIAAGSNAHAGPRQASAGAIDFEQVGDGKFSYIAEGYCHEVSCTYPWEDQAHSLRGYADTDDVEGLSAKQTCLKKCVETFGIVEGIYLPLGKCGCCPRSWDGSHKRHEGYHLYRVADDVVAQMTPIPAPIPTTFKPSWYGDSKFFQFLGNGYCGKWYRGSMECGKYGETSGSGVEAKNVSHPVRLSYCARTCADRVGSNEVAGVYVIEHGNDIACGCCLAEAADGEKWSGSFHGGYANYHLYKLSSPISKESMQNTILIL